MSDQRAQLTSWQTRETARPLKILAAEQQTTVQALTAEALNLLFAKNGKPQMARP